MNRRTKHRTLALAALVTIGLLTSAPAVSADEPATVEPKVTRSTDANHADYPAQVALLSPGNPDPYSAQFCGGTHILADWVLTAAHCVYDGGEISTPDVLLATGSLDGSGERIPVAQTIVHSGYSEATLENDIAVMRLATPSRAPIARLVFPGQESVVTAGAPARVTGWGGLRADEEAQEYPTNLQVGSVNLISDAECGNRLAAYQNSLGDPAGQVCAGDGQADGEEQADACRGDSGGPLWLELASGRRQVGIVSFGPTCGLSPSVYTDVTAFLGWVEGATGRQLASFPDIPLTTHERNIETVTVEGIAGGMTNGLFAPAGAVTRGQMATFLARALDLAPVASGSFSDVAGTAHAGNINAVAAAGIAGGYSDGTYRPNEPVSRGQMATFIARALELAPVSEGSFSDVAGTTHAGNINAVAAAGIAGGYSDGTYRPGAEVNRGQMATFIVRGFLD